MINIFSKIKTWAAIAGGVIVAVAFAWVRKSGVDSERSKQLQDQKELQDEYDEIDNQPVDFDASISKLRDRANK